jgi:proteic killer suppression protein
MIRTIRHKGLGRLYEENDPRGVMAEHVERLRDILTRLDHAEAPSDLDLPALRLHALKGKLKGLWAVTVRANWRVTFRFSESDAFDVDYLDYH